MPLRGRLHLGHWPCRGRYGRRRLCIQVHLRAAHAAHKVIRLVADPVVNVGVVAGGMAHDDVLELGHLLHELLCLAVESLVAALELNLLALEAVLPLLLALAALGGGGAIALEVASAPFVGSAGGASGGGGTAFRLG